MARLQLLRGQPATKVTLDVFGEAEATGRSPAAVLIDALHDGTLPKRWRSNEDKLVALLALCDLGHVEAGRRLGWSRWTVAEWRQRLGMVAP